MRRWRIGMHCTIHGVGEWIVDGFSVTDLVWLKPHDDLAESLAKLTVNGRVGVSVKDLQPPQQEETLQ